MKASDIPTARIQVLIQCDTAHGQFNDALYFTETELDALKESELEAQIQARVDGWVSAVSNPPAAVEPTTEELTRYAEQLQKELDIVYTKEPQLIQARIDVLTAKVGR